MYATISADIVSSTSLSVEETIGLKQRIEELFNVLGKKYSSFQGRQIKGDYIECLVKEVSSVFRISLIIKTCIKSFRVERRTERKDFQKYGVRMAIGIGDMRIMENGIWDGEAIYMSGRALEGMKSLNKGTLSLLINKKQLSSVLQTVALLTDAHVNNLSVRQSEVVYFKLLGYKEIDISKELKITQPAVNHASVASNWYCIEKALKYFEHINFEEYE